MDLLLRFPDKATAVEFGVSQGVTSEDENGENQTISALGTINLAVIGEHYTPTGKTLKDEFGDVPEMTPVPGWWILVRAPDSYPIPDALAPVIVWNSADATEDAPNPRDPSFPQLVFV
ncbi:MAG: hypothetical protein K9N23_16475 [Akkermansiaceae bacterium]|nr:hypothetical protein [Akkermansiaceae bacterium]MCF7733287.1 hypothetical protein [Akkermansiaceae bacterium]